ncbi:MAG: DinB family protein [Chloroflexota bacterium]
MSLKTVIWRQFGAAIDMLDNALGACPERLWQARIHNEALLQPQFAEFWYVAYHALFWLDFYLADSAETFTPPAPFTLSELEAGLVPERVYTKAELQTYLAYGRNKCRHKLETSTDLFVPQRCRPDWPEMSVAELLIYNMRHVQEHVAQLSLFLGQHVDTAPGWVAKARDKDDSVS